jgi:two-component system sensor histidine kinase ChvG
VTVVVVAPLITVWLAVFPDADSTEHMRRAVDEATRLVASRPITPSTVERAAADAHARIRVIDPAGRVRLVADHEPATSLRDRAGDLAFGPSGPPRLDAYVASLPPPGDRVDVRAARSDGVSTHCGVVLSGQLTVCSSARRAADDVVLAERSSPRAIRALYDLRFPVMKLTAIMLVLGLALATWLVRTLVRPIEQLRLDVLDRASSPRTAAPIERPTTDEFGDLAGAFNELLRALDDRARRNETLAADLAHELKNPIAAVRASADALQSGATVDASRADRLARALATSGARLDAVVTRYLELARAEAGLAGEPRDEVDLGAMTRGIRDALALDARYANVRFDVDGDARTTGVSIRIESALRNVMDNAASFAGAGGTVTVRVRSSGDEAVVVVKDTGPGISAENLPRVFERFFTTRPEQRGTGLGLAMARAVAEAHGGSLKVQTSPGEGATFTFVFSGSKTRASRA